MISILLIVHALGSISDPIARYAQFAKTHPAVEVRYAASMDGKQQAEGVFKFHRPDLLYFRAKGAKVDYTLSITPKDYVEVESKAVNELGEPLHAYDEFPPNPKIVFYDSDIAPLPNSLVPKLLLTPDIKPLFGTKYDVNHAGSSDVLHRRTLAPSGATIDIWVTVDGEGKILDIKREGSSGGRSKLIEWIFTDYSKPKDPSPHGFETTIPLGYRPNSVPRLTTPLEIGQPAPTKGWIRNGKPLDLLEASGHKPFLLIFSNDDSLPGRAAQKWSGALLGKIPVFLITPGGLSDPDGSRIKRLGVPASPMFYLIDGSGRVKKLWLGFDRDKADEFKADVLQSASAKAGG